MPSLGRDRWREGEAAVEGGQQLVAAQEPDIVGAFDGAAIC
jgi:hypothetical protein